MFKKITFGLIFCLFSIYLGSCIDQSSSKNSITETKPMVSATIFPIYDLIRQIAGEKLEVNLIVKANDSPHT
ncbi:uncharacterized protein METZ01_LOCUS506763, partial [marine metagenome]